MMFRLFYCAGNEKQRPLLFSGAPRADHTGLVTLFTKNQNTWTVTRNIRGEQVSEETLRHNINPLHQ